MQLVKISQLYTMAFFPEVLYQSFFLRICLVVYLRRESNSPSDLGLCKMAEAQEEKIVFKLVFMHYC